MKNCTVHFVGFILLLAVFSALVIGQDQTGTVLILVRSVTGEPISNASLTIERPRDEEGEPAFDMTGAEGTADLTNLKVGAYVIRAKADGYSEQTIKVSVFAGENAAIVIDLRPLDANRKDTPAGADSSQSITIMIERTLPAEPTFRSLVDTSTFTNDEPLGAGISIDRSTGPDNVYYFDGHEITNPTNGVLNRSFNVPLELISEVRIKSGGDKANYQGSIGGIVSLVTESWKTDWHGGFGLSFKPQAFNGGSRPVLNRFGVGTGQFNYFQPDKDDSNAYFPHAKIGGPIISDKLFFYSAYTPLLFQNRRSIDYFDTPGPSQSVTQTIRYKEDIRQEFAFLRFDTRPHNSLDGTISFLWNPTIQDGALPENNEGLFGIPQSGSGLTGAGYLATRGGRINSNLVNGSLTWRPSGDFSLKGRAGQSFLDERLGSFGLNDQTRYLCSSTGTPQDVPGSNCAPGFDSGANNFVNKINANTRTSAEVEAGLRFFRLFGYHTLRIGYQFDRVERDVNQGYQNTGIIVLYYGRSIANLVGLPPTGNQCDYSMNPNPTNCWVGSGFMQRFGTVAKTSSHNQAIYLHDYWRFNDRVDLNLGIRFENENVPQFRDDYELSFGWGDKVSPRINASVDLFENGETIVSASYFWNFDRLKHSWFEGYGGDQIDVNGRSQNGFARDYFEILPSRGVSYTDYTYSNVLGGDTDITNVLCPITNGPGYSVCRFSLRRATQDIVPFFPAIDPDLRPTRQETFSVNITQRLPADFILQGRYIHNSLRNVVEEIGVFDNGGRGRSLLANPGRGVPCDPEQSLVFSCKKAERKYDALEINLDSRGDDYFFNVSYVYSRLFGNYTGLANSDELGLVSPNNTGAFDLASSGFTANGVPDNARLPIDRPHVFKAFGGYTYRWNNLHWTNLSALTTLQSGTPLTTYYKLFGLSSSILFGRGDLGRTDSYSVTDFRIGHKFDFDGSKKYTFEIYADILNLFDEQNEISRQTSISTTDFTQTELTAGGCSTCTDLVSVTDTIFNQGGIEQHVVNYLNSQGVSGNGFRNDYNLPNIFQAQRSVRFGVRFRF